MRSPSWIRALMSGPGWGLTKPQPGPDLTATCNFFNAKRYRSRWETLDRFRYRFQPIKFMNSVVSRLCETQAYRTYKKSHFSAERRDKLALIMLINRLWKCKTGERLTANSCTKIDQLDGFRPLWQSGRENFVRFGNQSDCRICWIPPAHELKERHRKFYFTNSALKSDKGGAVVVWDRDL